MLGNLIYRTIIEQQYKILAPLDWNIKHEIGACRGVQSIRQSVTDS